jgi:hypothetical protein
MEFNFFFSVLNLLTALVPKNNIMAFAGMERENQE